MEKNEFIVVFPDKGCMVIFSKISEILMSVYGLKIKIIKSKLDPKAIEVLHSVWVKIYGLPTIACKKEVVMKISTLVGEPIVVDELSLIKTGCWGNLPRVPQAQNSWI
jgi:hypothetical protein